MKIAVFTGKSKFSHENSCFDEKIDVFSCKYHFSRMKLPILCPFHVFSYEIALPQSKFTNSYESHLVSYKSLLLPHKPQSYEIASYVCSCSLQKYGKQTEIGKNNFFSLSLLIIMSHVQLTYFTTSTTNKQNQ